MRPHLSQSAESCGRKPPQTPKKHLIIKLIPNFELRSEETGGTYQKKNSTYKPCPGNILSGHTKVVTFECAIWAWRDFNQKTVLDNYYM